MLTLVVFETKMAQKRFHLFYLNLFAWLVHEKKNMLKRMNIINSYIIEIISRSSYTVWWQMDKLLVLFCCERKFCWHSFGFTCPLIKKKKNSVHPSSRVSEILIESMPRSFSGGLSCPINLLRYFMLFFPSICHHLYISYCIHTCDAIRMILQHFTDFFHPYCLYS